MLCWLSILWHCILERKGKLILVLLPTGKIHQSMEALHKIIQIHWSMSPSRHLAVIPLLKIWFLVSFVRRSRLQLVDNTSDLLPAQLLRKYIAYAREYVHPQLDEDARKEIGDFYLHLRTSQYSNDSTPITPRQLESLVRLSQVRITRNLQV